MSLRHTFSRLSFFNISLRRRHTGGFYLFRHASVSSTYPCQSVNEVYQKANTVPKESIVMLNQWEIDHGPDQWTDPDVLKSKHSLNSDGEFVKSIQVIPLSTEMSIVQAKHRHQRSSSS